MRCLASWAHTEPSTGASHTHSKLLDFFAMNGFASRWVKSPFHRSHCVRKCAVTKFGYKNNAELQGVPECDFIRRWNCVHNFSRNDIFVSHSYHWGQFECEMWMNVMGNLLDTCDAVCRSHCSATSPVRNDCCKCHPKHSPSCRPIGM